jgi:hypothetical protein
MNNTSSIQSIRWRLGRHIHCTQERRQTSKTNIHYLSLSRIGLELCHTRDKSPQWDRNLMPVPSVARKRQASLAHLCGAKQRNSQEMNRPTAGEIQCYLLFYDCRACFDVLILATLCPRTNHHRPVDTSRFLYVAPICTTTIAQHIERIHFENRASFSLFAFKCSRSES